MKFYIASKLENAETVKRVAKVLKSAGHIHTYDWTEHGSVQGEGKERISQVAEMELAGVLNTDMVIVILPGGRGTHAELGIALGSGRKNIIICSETEEYFMQDERTCAFYWNKNVFHAVGDINDWIRFILDIANEIERHENKKNNSMINKIDLYAIRARCEAASPGPWIYIHRKKYDEHNVSVPSCVAGETMRLYLFNDGPGSHREKEDALFIAHARQDILALLDEIERLSNAHEAETAQMEDDRDHWKYRAEALERTMIQTPGKCSSCLNFGTNKCSRGMPHLCTGWQFDQARFAEVGHI